MLDKKSFAKLLDHIVELEQADERFDRALKDYGDTLFTNYTSKEPSYLAGWLSETMGLKKDDDTIFWWLWDCPNHGEGDEESCTVTFPDKKHAPIVVKKSSDVYDLIVTTNPQPRTPENGVNFALDVIAVLQATNKATGNEGWEERDALLEFTYNKIKDEWMLKHGNRE